ncbi:MAG: hypothetical protein GWO85_00935 [Simkaniaceae bacterium]|nr:hypothetical protein [Simkaniaceae bacterium]
MMVVTQQQIKHVRALQHRKYRKEYSQFIIEGFRVIDEALHGNRRIAQVFIEQSLLENPQYRDLIHRLTERNIPLYESSRKQIKDMSDTQTPSGILAVCPIPEADKNTKGNWLYLDEISDPGNTGTLLRTAAWFGIGNVAFSKGCVDPYSPKTVRAGMGAHFFINIVTESALEQINTGKTVLGAGMEGEPLSETTCNAPWVLVLGSEAHGLTKQTARHIDRMITIPKLGHGESLNVAVAGSIILNELTKK